MGKLWETYAEAAGGAELTVLLVAVDVVSSGSSIWSQGIRRWSSCL